MFLAQVLTDKVCITTFTSALNFLSVKAIYKWLPKVPGKRSRSRHPTFTALPDGTACGHGGTG